MLASEATGDRERRAVTVRGIVQGVGFRPFVYHLAVRLGLGGFVRNQSGAVAIEIEGEAPRLDQFLDELTQRPPPLAQIAELTWQPLAPRCETAFRIEASDADAASPVFISPDVATCPQCLAELFDPADRRCGYPFLNCTHCGPRLTIITGAPYDRPRTTLADFTLCAACQAEYDDPANRRFHAQPTACPACGPRLTALDAQGQPVATDEPLAWLAAQLRAGRIAAIKGLGGYHLACDATQQETVAELRRRKHRDEKPFAIMVCEVAAVTAYCHLDDTELDLLRSPHAPIVLLRRRTPCPVADAVAPGNPLLGVMLPYTPLHHLLLRACGGPLVMTSGNRSDEPIASRDDEALEKLAGIADLFLVHNRPIHVRCDDSVTRIVGGAELPLRRSRGYAPRPVALPFECPQPILAVGGQLKGAFALGHGRQAILSHHLGDLDHFEAFRAFEKDVQLYERLFALRPSCLVCDLHPDYAATRYAGERAAREGIPLLAVQHHHAHLASGLVENGLTEPAIGVTFDGTGCGTDGTIWGGEFLVGDCRAFRRAAHLRCVGMPGGEQAIREPWRLAAAHLRDAGVRCAAWEARQPPEQRVLVELLLQKRFRTPLTSSAGRLFDAAASLIGVRDRVSYEGQAAVELEWLASTVSPDGNYPFASATKSAPLLIDTRPLIRGLVADVARGCAAPRIARRFHSTVVAIIATVCGRLREESGLEVVVLSGGVFLNALLTVETTARLQAAGFRVYRQRLVPPNDGGLCLGQLAIAAHQFARDDQRS
ncbi:MAG: carbamoyltransferase HypF [Planctomycetia bacterium]|nr:carbamoyltransferase HypF [Planctomycetia bacterium]